MKLTEIYDPEESKRTRGMVDRMGNMFRTIEQSAISGMRMRDVQAKDQMFQHILDVLRGKAR